jgi:hypothetical protein
MLERSKPRIFYRVLVIEQRLSSQNTENPGRCAYVILRIDTPESASSGARIDQNPALWPVVPLKVSELDFDQEDVFQPSVIVRFLAGARNPLSERALRRSTEYQTTPDSSCSRILIGLRGLVS